MEDIRVYDFDFNLLHIENDIITSNWTIYYNDIGTWEGHFDLKGDIVPVFMENDYLVIIQGGKQAIVTGKLAGDDFAVYGRTVNWILTRRTIAKFKLSELSIVKDPECIARYVVSTAFSDVAAFTLGNKAGLAPIEDFWRNSTNAASTVVIDLLNKQNAGHRVFFDIANKKWVFEVYKGSENPLIISAANNNAQNMRYLESSLDEFSSGWYEQTYNAAAEWNACTNTPVLTDNLADNYAKKYIVTAAGTQFGLTFAAGNYIYCNTKSGKWQLSKTEPSSFWVYIVGSRIGIYKWDGILDGNVESEAQCSLTEKKRIKKTTAGTYGISYGSDYQLGDTLTLQLEFGLFKKTVTRRIIGVSFWYENNNIGEKPIFKED